MNRADRIIHRARALLVAFVGSALLVACAATTTTDVWRNPEVGDVRFRSLLVIGIAEDQLARRKYEDELAQALRERGLEVATSYSVVPGSGKLTEAQVDEVVRAGGFDGVIVARVTDTSEEAIYLPGQIDNFGSVYYGYYGYYDYAFNRVYQPGYYETIKTLTLETLLYSAPEGSIAWGMRSESIEPEAVERLIRSLVDETVRNLAESGLL